MAKLDRTLTFGKIKYRYSRIGRKWLFEAPNFTLIQPCGGHAVASLVAAQMAGALKRTKGTGLDGLARTKIKQLTGF